MKKIIVFIICGLCLFPSCVHAQDQYRFLALGDSITLSQPLDHQWYNNCGMAASTPEKDWVHLVSKELKKHYASVTSDVRNIDFERLPDQLGVQEDMVKQLSENNPYDLIVIQDADPIFNVKDANQYEPNLRHFLSVIRQYNPHAQIVLINDFLRTTRFKSHETSALVNQILEKVAQEFDCQIADLSAISNSLSYQAGIGTTVYGSDGAAHTIDVYCVAAHPGDKGMAYIAAQILDKIGIKLQTSYRFDDLTEKKLNGWQKKKNNSYYYVDNQKVKGLYFIRTHYYYFDEKTGALKTKTLKVGQTTYYLNAQGMVQLIRRKNTYYNENNVKLKKDDGTELEVIERVKAKINTLCKKNDAKKVKLKKCFNWVNRQKTSKTKAKGTIAAIADGFFDRKINSQAKNSVFAYMAHVIGYKNVKVGITKKKYVILVNDKMYDPSLKKNNYALKIKGKYQRKKVPYCKYKPIITGKPTAIVRYNTKERKLYYNNGQAVTGIAVYRNKFYAFDAKGNYDEELNRKLKISTAYFENIRHLKALIGNPIRTSYSSSCIADGEDGIWQYKHFTVTTYRSRNGAESFVSARSNYQNI